MLQNFFAPLLHYHYLSKVLHCGNITSCEWTRAFIDSLYPLLSVHEHLHCAFTPPHRGGSHCGVRVRACDAFKRVIVGDCLAYLQSAQEWRRADFTGRRRHRTWGRKKKVKGNNGRKCLKGEREERSEPPHRKKVMAIMSSLWPETSRCQVFSKKQRGWGTLPSHTHTLAHTEECVRLWARARATVQLTFAHLKWSAPYWP